MVFALGIVTLVAVMCVGHIVDKSVQKRNGAKPNKNGRIEDSPTFMKFFWGVIGAMIVWYWINAGDFGHVVEGCFGSMRC